MPRKIVKTFHFKFKMLFKIVILSLSMLVGGEAQVRSIVRTLLNPLFDGSEFDYIVVGAGAAGCAAAARLALAGHDVLLVEAGGPQTLQTKIPGLAMGLLGSSVDWQYETQPNNISCLSSLKGQCRFSRGKCLGGSTSINYMMYVRGNRYDYDEPNITDWTWNDLEPYFFKYEAQSDLKYLPRASIRYHNTTGIMDIGFFDDSDNEWHSRIIEGFKSLNFPYNADVNSDSQIGVSQVTGFVYKGQRMSTARAYLENDEVKKKLKVAENTRCTGIIIDKNNIARGITVSRGTILERTLKLYAKKEVILSAGAIGTAQLLMLSGIGPEKQLKELGIPVRANLPVGQDMADHVLPLLFISVDGGFGLHLWNPFVFAEKGVEAVKWLATSSGPLASNGLTDVSAFVNTHCYDFKTHQLRHEGNECELPTLQFINAYIDKNIIRGIEPIIQNAVGFKDEIIDQLSDANVNHAFLVVSPVILQPKSRGNISLASSDPLDNPAIFPNYLSDVRDLDEMLRSIAIVEDLVNTPIYKEHNASILHLEFDGCPKYEEDRLGYWRCYCRHMTYSVYHAVGTTGLERVVDKRLRVKGIKNLRVADAGILRQLPRGNTAAVSIAIGERVASMILQDKL